MGLNFADQYSLLHFAVGVVLYFWNIPLILAIILHTIFEIIENTKMGMKFINTYIIHPGYFSWPGGKNYADSLINNVGDTIFFAVGWVLAAYLDVEGIKQGDLKSLCSKPALLAYGMKDKAIEPDYAIRDFKALFPGSNVVKMPNAGHYSQEDEPELLINLIKEFMTENENIL